MAVSQYIALQRASSMLPIHAHFVESKRWGDGKTPKVTVGSTVTFGGFIERIVQEANVDRTLSFIQIEVGNIAYLSNRANPPISPSRMLLNFSEH